MNPREVGVLFKAGLQFTTRTLKGTWNFKVWAVGILTPSRNNVYRVMLVQRKRGGKTPFSDEDNPFQVLNIAHAIRAGYITWDATFAITNRDTKRIVNFC